MKSTTSDYENHSAAGEEDPGAAVDLPLPMQINKKNDNRAAASERLPISSALPMAALTAEELLEPAMALPFANELLPSKSRTDVRTPK